MFYYYDCEKYYKIHVFSFRVGVAEFENYAQGDDLGVEHVYGVVGSTYLSSNMGSVETKEDSIVIFPNAFQHHVDPFDLQDPSKPGHRKILCFFICSPENNHIVSTDKVPPQQQDWWSENINDNGYLGKLPL
jgi:hypothetical protein